MGVVGLLRSASHAWCDALGPPPWASGRPLLGARRAPPRRQRGRLRADWGARPIGRISRVPSPPLRARRVNNPGLGLPHPAPDDRTPADRSVSLRSCVAPRLGVRDELVDVHLQRRPEPRGRATSPDRTAPDRPTPATAYSSAGPRAASAFASSCSHRSTLRGREVPAHARAPVPSPGLSDADSTRHQLGRQGHGNEPAVPGSILAREGRF